MRLDRLESRRGCSTPWKPGRSECWQIFNFFFGFLYVLDHSLVSALIISSDLVDDQLRVTEDLQTADLEGSGYAETGDECFILGLIVGGVETES